MSERKKRYIKAAIDVFSRYGVRRTTMGDIAAEAGVSRQSLYGAYANKQDIMRAAMRQIVKDTLELIEADWRNCTTTEEKLDIYLKHTVVDFFERLRAMPDSIDLLSEKSDAGGAVLRNVDEAKRAALARQFEPYRERLRAAGMTTRDIADFLQNSSQSFMHVAADEAHLKRLLDTLKASILALIGEAVRRD